MGKPRQRFVGSMQADCYAGVWAHSVFAAGDLEAGDVEEAIDAAGSVGDDRLQRRAGGGINTRNRSRTAPPSNGCAG